MKRVVFHTLKVVRVRDVSTVDTEIIVPVSVPHTVIQMFEIKQVAYVQWDVLQTTLRIHFVKRVRTENGAKTV